MNVTFYDYINAKTELDKMVDYSKLRSVAPGSGTAEDKWNYEYLPSILKTKQGWCQQVADVSGYQLTLKPEVPIGRHAVMVSLESGQTLVLSAKTPEDNFCQIDKFLYQINPDTRSTSDQKDFLSKAITNVFRSGRYEIFEDGIKSVFSKAIDRIIQIYKNEACQLLSDMIRSINIESDLLCQTIRSLGALHNDETKQKRFEIIVPFLLHISPFIRDCAALALYDLELPEAIPYIRQAIRVERYKSLKRDLENIVESLEDNRSAKINPEARE